MKRCAAASRWGFSLLEMSVVLVIAGMMVGMVAQTQKATQPKNCNVIGRAQLTSIQAAIEKYAIQNQRYPKPAARNNSVSDSQVGNEVATGNGLDFTGSGATKIWYGALPFKTLGLPSSFGADCWGNKFSYVVSDELTSFQGSPAVSPFVGSTYNGHIVIKSGPGTLLSNAAYAVISHGENGATNGAVARNYSGASTKWCTGSGTSYDKDNCLVTGVVYAAPYNNGKDAATNPKFFDDLVIFGGKLNSDCNKSSYDSTSGVTWSQGTATCADAVLTGPLRNNQTQTVTDKTDPSLGTATFKCVNGALQLQPGYTCTAKENGACGPESSSTPISSFDSSQGVACTSSSGIKTQNAASAATGWKYTWVCGAANGGTDSPTCSAPAVAVCGSVKNGCAAGMIVTGSTKTVNGTGISNCISPSSDPTYQIDCWRCSIDGTGTNAASCSSNVPYCTGGVLSWRDPGTGETCTATFPLTLTGQTAGPVNNTTLGYSGAGSATCSGTAWGAANGTCVSLKADGVCGGTNGSIVTEAPSTGLCSTGAASAVTNSSTGYTWTCGGVYGGATSSCSANLKVDGKCGDANASVVTSAPSSATDLCTAGTASSVANSGTGFTWTCGGAYGGTTSSCSANLKVNGACGAANGGSFMDYIGISDSQLCTSGTPSNKAMGRVDPVGSTNGNGLQWTCSGSNGGADAHCQATRIDYLQNATCGSSSGQNLSSAPTSNLCGDSSTPVVSSNSGAHTYNWICSGTSGGTSINCSANIKTDANCGSSAGQTLSSSPTSNLCGDSSTPSVSADYTGHTYSWTCGGINSGANASCSATMKVNPACGSANGGNFGAPPTSGLCNAGTASTPTYSAHHYSWTCTGSGTTVSCDATASSIVYGACGLANGSTYSSAPTTGLCGGGTASGITTNSNSYTWSCTGTDGSVDSCSATRSVNGVCGSANGTSPSSAPTTGLCSAGNATSVADNGDEYDWSCVGTNGGTTDGCWANAPGGSGPTTAPPKCAAGHYNCASGTATNKVSIECGGTLFTWDCTNSLGSSVQCQQNCFLSDVMVTMADGSTKLISELQAGDAIRGYTQINHVLVVPTHQSDQAIYGFNGGKKFVTGGHPFYTKQGWKAIDPALTPTDGHNVKTTTLKVGDTLLLDNGKPLKIRSIEREESGDHELFNPSVDGDHTYYANGILVHNKYGCTIGDPGNNVTPITDGTCGGANGQTYISAPTNNLCATGIESGVTTNSNSYNWTCNGINGGATQNCTAGKGNSSGSCGSSAGQNFYSAPNSGLCGDGSTPVVSSNSGAHTYSWSCSGFNGGGNVSCGANMKVDGTCGSSAGQTLSSTPTSGLCGDGSTPAVSSTSTSYQWACSGVNGGSSTACTASKAAGTNGVCGTYLGSCTVGTASSVSTPGFTDYTSGSYPGTGYNAGIYSGASRTAFNSVWTCSGTGTGTTATCSLPSVDCGNATVYDDQCSGGGGGNLYCPPGNACGTATATCQNLDGMSGRVGTYPTTTCIPN